jgi:DNA-binding beta-propeller fold protein YncE
MDAGGGTGFEYRLYVANESSDRVTRVVFDPVAGARIEREIPVGVMPADVDGPHGIATSPDGELWYVTIAHGTPDGAIWKFRAGADSLVARTTLGRFPASIGTSPDGRFLFVVNFNLHGDPVPSSLSIVYAPDLIEIARVTSCVMPHGGRTNAAGTRHYHVCMHSDQLVELDIRSFSISSRFSLTPGHEGPLELDDLGVSGEHHAAEPVCSPTWVAAGAGPRAGRFVYVACNRAAEVLEVDVEAREVTRRFATGAGPYNLESSPDGRLLAVTLKGSQALSVIDLDAGREVARLETSRPITHGVVISPDNRYAFVTNESIGGVPGTLDVFDLGRLERVASAELGLQAGGVALWRFDPIGEGPVPGQRR